jgi:hypothetical protein
MQNFRRVVNLFKRKFPHCRASVRRVRLPEHLQGDCSCKDGVFLIRIKNSLSEDQAIDTFLHEWAHILSWNIPGDDHGAEWGKSYSKVYRIFLKDFVEKN